MGIKHPLLQSSKETTRKRKVLSVASIEENYFVSFSAIEIRKEGVKGGGREFSGGGGGEGWAEIGEA